MLALDKSAFLTCLIIFTPVTDVTPPLPHTMLVSLRSKIDAIRFMKGIDTIDHGLWTISGYLHSAFGFLYIMLILIILILRLYHMLRFRVFSLNVFA